MSKTPPPAGFDLADLTARTAPETCRSMAEVRDGVDRLDRALVTLIAERSRYMEAAARIKPDRGVVRDEDRIEDVVSKVLAQADKAGLSAAIAEPVWRELVERSIAYEFEVWDATRS
ncbi:MAG: chorismate mutase [Oceanicaulis sp.]